jgi:uroporphyrinogen decarboxylase
MRYESVDHPPLVVPGPWPAARKRWEGEGLPKGVNLYDFFELPRLETAVLKMETMFFPPFEEKILEENDEYVVKINRHGVKERNFRDGSSMPEFLEYPIKGRESLGWLREKLNPDTPGRISPGWLEHARKARENGALLLLNGGMYFAFLNEHMGTEELMTVYFDDPEFVHEVNDLLCTLCEKAINASLAEIQVDFIGYHEDMAYKNGSLISPSMFREFMTPYYKRIADIVNPSEIDLQMLDSDGNVMELIPLWLEHGINILCPMEVAAGMDVLALRYKFGRGLRMTGGFDKRILAAGKREIKAELERIRPVIEDGGYIPTIDHGTPPDVSFENVCYYVQCLKEIYGITTSV